MGKEPVKTTAPTTSVKPPSAVPPKPEVKTPVTTAQQNNARPNYLAAFQKSVGDKQDPNITAVGMDFGRHLGTLKGSNKSSSRIGRATANGRHANSNAIVQAYAIQGKKMPANVSALIDQLDNLAAHSTAVAAMDDKVRVQMIGQGNKALDATVITAQENAILGQLSELTIDVTTAEARLDFKKKELAVSGAVATAAGTRASSAASSEKAALDIKKKKIDIATAELALREATIEFNNAPAERRAAAEKAQQEAQKRLLDIQKASVDLATSELSYKTSIKDFNQEAIDAQASDWLEDTTEEELGAAISAGQLPDFVSIEAATIKYQDRVQARAATVQSMATVDKTNRESMVAGVATFGVEALEALVSIGVQQREEGNLFPSVDIPGSNQTIPLVVLEDALATRKNQELENGVFDQREIQDNNVMIAALSQQASLLRQNTGIDAINPINLQMQENFKLAVNAKTPQEQREAIVAIRTDMASIRSDMLAGLSTPAEKDAFSQLNSRGRNTLGTAIPYLSTVSPESVMASVAGNETYTAIADAVYLFAEIALSEEQLASQDNGLLGQIDSQFASGGKEAATVEDKMQAFLSDEEMRVRVAEMTLAQLNTEFYVAQLDGAFKRVTEAMTGGAEVVENPELLQELANARVAFFGDNVTRPTAFSNINNPELVTNQPVQVLQTNEDGEQIASPVLRANGEAVLMKSTNPNYLLDQIQSFDIALKDAGYTGPSLLTEFLDGDSSDAASMVAERNTPVNLDQHALVNIALPIYAKNPMRSPTEIFSGAVLQQFEQLKQQRVYDYETFDSQVDLIGKATEMGIGFNRARSKILKVYSQETTDNVELDRLAKTVAGMSVQDLINAGALTQSEVLEAVTNTQRNK